MKKHIRIIPMIAILLIPWSLKAGNTDPTHRPKEMRGYVSEYNQKHTTPHTANNKKNKKQGLDSKKEGLYEVTRQPRVELIAMSDNGNHIVIIEGVTKQKGDYINGMKIIKITESQVITKSAKKQTIFHFPPRENSGIIKKELGKGYK